MQFCTKVVHGKSWRHRTRLVLHGGCKMTFSSTGSWCGNPCPICKKTLSDVNIPEVSIGGSPIWTHRTVATPHHRWLGGIGRVVPIGWFSTVHNYYNIKKSGTITGKAAILEPQNKTNISVCWRNPKIS